MNYLNYIEKKTKGLAEVIKIGGGYAFATKRFNSEDGSQLAPEIEAVDIKILEDRKIELQKEIDAINQIITDLKALK